MSAEEHHKAGVELLESGELNEAIVEFTRALGIDSEMAVAYSYRGFAYNKLGEYQRAIQDYDVRRGCPC